MNLSYIDGVKLVNKAYEKVADGMLFHRWVANHEDKISYNDFKNKLIQIVPVVHKSEEEILKDVKGILDNFTIERGEE